MTVMHHSFVLETVGSGLVKLGYKCESPDDLDVDEQRTSSFGAAVERMSKGDNRTIGGVPAGKRIEIHTGTRAWSTP
jgi:catechol 2,3-dioxygenase